MTDLYSVKNRAWHAVQNSNINYIHDETPQVVNDKNNDYKQLESQETKQQVLHQTYMHTHLHTHKHVCTDRQHSQLK